VVGYTGFRGTAALPAIYWEEDPDTGVYSAAANQLSFSAGGVQYMNIKATPTFGSITATNTTGNTIGFQTKPSQGATSTGSVIGAEIQPRVANTFGAGAVIGMNVSAIVKGGNGTSGNVTDLRGIEVELSDDNPDTSTRTITTSTLLRLRHQLSGAHTTTNDPVGIEFVTKGGGTGWGFAMKFADDSGAGLADLASSVTTVNGVIVVQIGSTTGYIPTYQTYAAS